MAKAVTMKSIAGQAGVTEATVSMSLANNSRIPAKTRERIQAIAKKMGYTPHPYVSALLRLRRQGRAVRDRPVLALINAFDTADGWKNAEGPTIRQMRDGAIGQAELRGYRAEEFWLHRDDMSPERLSKVLRARGIHGLLLSPLAEGAATPALRWDYFACVCLSVPLAPLTITTVCNDHFLSCLQTARECHKLGYRRMGLVLRKMHRERFQGRWDGGMQVAPLLLPDIKLVETLLLETWDAGEEFAAWFRREKPEVIISPGAEWFHPMLAGMGVAVPDDVGLAGLACSRLGHECSGVYQDGRAIGAAAIDTLIAKVERFERGLLAQPVNIMLESVWNPGKTLRKMR
ncbi:MAG: LacI family transcriptional regulator [Opitutaceae bacterium]|jgi:DNA-binding LacI/PurR family transcriptional regulator|nr:LacI family transcriptional regulator [Opitutaceae bacterium]